MSTQSNKQCPNCKRWFTRQKSFKHHIRHCRRANCVEIFNDIGSSASNPLLSKFTSEVLRTVFQKSNLNQSDEDEYEEHNKKMIILLLILIQIAGKSMMKNQKKT
jgi:hypothetical protein